MQSSSLISSQHQSSHRHFLNRTNGNAPDPLYPASRGALYLRAIWADIKGTVENLRERCAQYRHHAAHGCKLPLVETPANEMRVSQSMHLESHADAGVVLNHYRGINGCHPRDDCSSVRRHPLIIIVVMWTLGAADELLQLPHGQPAREHDCLEAPSFTPAGR